jgi:hypothetical protein
MLNHGRVIPLLGLAKGLTIDESRFGPIRLGIDRCSKNPGKTNASAGPPRNDERDRQIRTRNAGIPGTHPELRSIRTSPLKTSTIPSILKCKSQRYAGLSAYSAIRPDKKYVRESFEKDNIDLHQVRREKSQCWTNIFLRYVRRNA